MAEGKESDNFCNIAKFDGEDKTYSSAKWAQDIEDSAEVFGWTAQQKLIIARRSLTGTAELWLRSEKIFKTYEELKAALQKEFAETVNAKEMHEFMSSRRKLPNETYYQYMLTMKELGKRAKFPDYVAIQYIIDGIIDSEVNKTILYGVSTYAALKEKLAVYEKMKTKIKLYDVPERPKKHQPFASTSTRRCFSCGEANHVASRCRNGIKCFRCNNYGHIGSQCTLSRDWNSASAASIKQFGTGGSGPSEKARPQASIKQAANGTLKQFAMFGSATNREAGGHSDFKMEFDRQRNVNKEEFIPKSSKKPVKVVNFNGKSVNALIDSGSEVNLMSCDLHNELNINKYEDNTILSGLGLSKITSRGKLYINVCIDGQCYEEVIFHIVPRDCMPYSIILGQEFLKNVIMVMREGSVLLMSESEEWLRRVNCCVSDFNVTDHIRDASVKAEVRQLMEGYQPTQIKEAPIELKIVLKDDKPVSQRPRRLSLAEQHTVEQQVDEWLHKGIIQVSYSEYSSPLVLVKKKDGSTRVCIDYRLLNRKIIKDEYPLPLIEDLIDRLKDAKVFSVLDLKNGFFHLRMSKDSVPYTAFVTHHGQYEFLRAPFGLSVSPKYFMRFIMIIFSELIKANVMMIFIDDIIIPAQNERECVARLRQVMEVAGEYGLEINWKKAKLICHEIEYLGHLIKDGEVRPSPEKVNAVAKYPAPVNTKQVQSFIGLTSYFRKYIKGYASIARPLTELMRKDAEFVFDKEQQDAFNTLKRKLVNDPVLKIFNPILPTELHTDASRQALAAILMQKHTGGELHPVHYMSKRTNEAERRYSSYELEALAIVEGVKKFRHYLFGIHFKIVTDCQAFELTLKKKDLTPKVARWVLLLNDYDYEVEHRPAARMQHTDALSRNPYVGAIVSLHEEMRLAQQRDEALSAIRQLIEKDGQYQDFWLNNGILYKGNQQQVVVPKTMEKEVIKRVHNNGHFASRKMKEAISKDYYIKNLDKKIEDIVSSCIPCLLASRKDGKQEGYLNPIQKEGTPLHTLHLDHIGPLTETQKRYNHILTMVDGFTKFVWLFPTKSTSSAEVINKLEIHQQIFGNPIRIVTDRGTAFTSGAFQKYCQDEEIQHVTITTGVPRGNGQVERIHRILIPMLTKLCIEEESVWYKHVSRVQRAINCTYQRSINTTPFQLFTGTKMHCKEDVEILNLLQQETINQYNEDRENLRQKAKQQIQKIQEENKKGFNKKRKQSTRYEEDDLVAIKRTQFGPSLKLKPKFLGPYKVTKVKRNDRYDVEKLYPSTEGPSRTSTAADFMKRWPETVSD